MSVTGNAMRMIWVACDSAAVASLQPGYTDVRAFSECPGN